MPILSTNFQFASTYDSKVSPESMSMIIEGEEQEGLPIKIQEKAVSDLGREILEEPAADVNGFAIKKGDLEYTNREWRDLTGIFAGKTREEAWDMLMSAESDDVNFIVENMDLFNEEESLYESGTGKYLGLNRWDKFAEYNTFARRQAGKFSIRKINKSATDAVYQEIKDFENIFRKKGGSATPDDFRWAHDEIRNALLSIYAF